MGPNPVINSRKWSLAGLVVLIITAWFSVGYYHPDEHFQILEFCNYKLGYSPASDLPWEFGVKCRPGLQPFIAWIFCKTMLSIGLYNPFIVAGMLRISMAVLTWLTIRKTISLFIQDFQTEAGKKIFILLSYFLWFVPYIGVRFSSENISANLFVLGIIYLVARKKQNKGILNVLTAGLLLGLSLFLRLQIGFAFIGVAVWLVLERFKFTDLLLLLFAGILGLGFGTLTDYWLYGQWVFTPYNYFDVNIIQKVAAKFGVYPWWQYFIMFFNLAIAPISLFLLPAFLVGSYKSKRHIFFLLIVVFLAGHFIIGHKEMRFLFPVVIPFIYLVCLGLEDWYIKYYHKKSIKLLVGTLVTINVAVLIFKMFTPAEEVIKYYNFLYNYAVKNNAVVLSFNKSAFWMDNIEVNFYKPQNVRLAICADSAGIDDAIVKNKGKEMIYLSKHLLQENSLAGHKLELIYCQFPQWVLRFNINNWQERSYIWAVYRISN